MKHEKDLEHYHDSVATEAVMEILKSEFKDFPQYDFDVDFDVEFKAFFPQIEVFLEISAETGISVKNHIIRVRFTEFHSEIVNHIDFQVSFLLGTASDCYKVAVKINDTWKEIDLSDSSIKNLWIALLLNKQIL